MFISPDDKRLKYSGRIDFEQEKGPIFVFPCTSVSVRFKGTSAAVKLKNSHVWLNNYMGFVIDGEMKKICVFSEDKSLISKHESEGDFNVFELFTGLPDTEHELMFFKCQDSANYIQFGGFVLNDGAEILDITEEKGKKLKLEFYGDSVTCGEVSEAVDYVKKTDPEHNGEYSNSYWSYSWMTARKLNAEIHCIGQGGVSLLDDTGWFDGPDYKGIFSMYDRIEYNMQLGLTKRFDFNSYMPDAVIIAIGQNDSHPYDFMKEDYDGEMAETWRTAYKYFVRLIRTRRPNAHIVLTTTILCHDEAWDRAIDDVCRELAEKDSMIHHFLYSENGKGTPGHIRKPEADKMSDELSAFLIKIL